MRSVETSEQAMGPGAGTRHLVTLTIQEFEEMAKVVKPGPYGSRLAIARAETVKILGHDIVMEVEHNFPCDGDDESAVVSLRWKDVALLDETYTELERLNNTLNRGGGQNGKSKCAPRN